MLRLRMRLETSIYEGQNFVFAILFILVAIATVAIIISVKHIQIVSIGMFFKPIKINRSACLVRLQQPILFYVDKKR